MQIDCAMPERFGLEICYTEGTEATPVMMHRAVLGSIERFIAILLEHCAGAFPLWLAPVQLKILTVTDDQKEYAGQGRRAAARERLAGRVGRPQRKARLQDSRGAAG